MIRPTKPKPDKGPKEVIITRSKTVKTYLSTHLLCPTKNIVGETLEKSVQIISQWAKRGSLLFNESLIHACSGQNDWTLQEGEIQTLINQACRIDHPERSSFVRARTGFTQTLQETYRGNQAAYDELLPPNSLVESVDGTFLCQLRTTYAKKYKTNFLNHLSVPMEKRVRAYMRGWWSVHEPTMKWENGVFEKAVKVFFQGEAVRELEKVPEKVLIWIREERRQLGLEEYTMWSAGWIEQNLKATIMFLYRINKFWDSVHDEHADQIRRKPFTLAPLHQTRRLFIDVDSTAFYLLLKSLGLLKVPPHLALQEEVHFLTEEKQRLMNEVKVVTGIQKDVMKENLNHVQIRLKNAQTEWSTQKAARERARKEIEDAYKTEKIQEEHKKFLKVWRKLCIDPQMDPPEGAYPDVDIQRVRLSKKHLTSDDMMSPVEWFRSYCEELQWRTIFNVEEASTKEHRPKDEWSFANHISTDGVALCLMFTKQEKVIVDPSVPKVQETVWKENLTEQLEGKAVWYVDPGRTNIVTAVKFKENGEIDERRQYRRNQYYQDAGITTANHLRRQWNHVWMENEEVKKFHKEHTFKTTEPKRWNKAVEEYSKVHKTIWREVSKPRHSMLSMRTYQGKQSALMNFWNSLSKTPEQRKNTVIVYGVCYRSMASGGRGEISTPVKVAHKTCKLCYPTLDLDEFNTSKMCGLCGKELEKLHAYRQERSHIVRAKQRTNKKEMLEVRGLRLCTNKNCMACRKTMFVDRDVNACINFWRLSTSISRPEYLSRSKKDNENQPTAPQGVVGGMDLE